MTTSLHESGPRTDKPTDNGARFLRAGRSELLVAALVAGIGVFLLVATVRMDVSSSVSYLGPRFFPAVVGTLLLALGVLLGVQVFLRTRPGRETAEHESGSAPEGSDWKPLGITLATLAAHVLLLKTAGWIIAGALLFWGVSYALGGRRVLRDLGISVVVSSAVQVAFSAGLGLVLPPGILVGVL
ncbi:tripartite tricarboxylate transporter TctB family protein [Haloactinomyces albus]|uniref:Tricarboxylic transport membrane protein n=1 Tax=Haloactinomyces albus TaxID=1352928 RepID=A0AAE3ZEV0_9ACTN|nr:tripartite tricarboxylate transporter TctB family protein [Haloactinomyces albus]MDR7301957.1 putative tricarboxylic transport membrane protein [Haloactinomyces albus]